jgi:hypothetical protein
MPVVESESPAVPRVSVSELPVKASRSALV